jgi:hypothetical protein
LKKARKNYVKYDYKHDLLFVAGLPKSGTSWLENMVAEYPGYKKNMLPQAIKFEQRNKGSHFLELEKEWLKSLENSLTVLKLHNYGSENNAEILKILKIPYIVLYRDLRDVAVSYYFYVKKTWHHPEYEAYKDLSIVEGLLRFSKTLLPAYKKWIDSWEQNVDPSLGKIIRYEDLKQNTFTIFTQIADHFQLPNGSERIKEIVQKNSFKKLTGGRKEGEENSSSFFRKGTSGDWKNHFTPEIKDKFKNIIGNQLIELGYEENLNW